MSVIFKNHIAGEWMPALSGKMFEKRNPSRIDEVLGLFSQSNKEDVDRAAEAARQAFPTWSRMPPPSRGEILFEAGRLMQSRKQELAEVISRENGKTVKSALAEVQSGIDMAFFAAGEGRRWYGRTTHSGLPQRLAMTRRVPVGVVGIITSWNFPWAITCWKTLPAMVCGNTAVLKSEENTPETAVHFVKIMEEAGLPAGVLNLIHGAGPAIGEALTLHPQVDMISFTGSSAVGKIIGRNCAGRLAKVSLELGGKNAVVVLEDADLDLAAEGVVCGAFSLAGQRCTATSRVIVQASVYGALMEKLEARTAELKVGAGSDEASEVTPLISRNQLERVAGCVERALKAGARLRLGGRQLMGGIYDQGYYWAPTVLDEVKADTEMAKEEAFGPVLVAFPADSYQEALRIHNAVPYGLSASIFTRDVSRAMSFLDDAEAGVCYVNAPTFGSEPHLPFGGMKDSGLGYREAGWSAIETFSEVKTLYVDYSGGIQHGQVDRIRICCCNDISNSKLRC